MSRYRLGVVPYLNAKPLVYHFEQNPHPDVTWVVDVPSRLVEDLRAGELDAALVSSIACLEDSGFVILPSGGIAARDRVDSIRLFCKTEPERLRRVALDTSSRTSTALARILLAECFDVRPEYVPMPPDLEGMLATADAGLLIGDPALRAFHGRQGPRTGLRVLDLGELWHNLTGLPFVFGVWAARKDAACAHLTALLSEARATGRTHLDSIADAAAESLGVPASVCRNYLRNVMVYDLGPQEWAGLQRFRDLAARHGLVPPAAPPFMIEGG